MTKPRIVFAGTPEFARVSLQALVDADQQVVAVYTQPDRPAGRGRKLTASPVKQYAQQLGIDILQPATLRAPAARNELAALRPDILVVAAYGLLLPQQILDVPRHGCLNVHASLLPRWRGAAPIQAAILAGDETTGISLMQMTAGLDCGPVYCDAAVQIGAGETAGELHDRLAELGGQLLAKELPCIIDGDRAAVPQDEERSTYAGKIDKADAELDWSLPAESLQRRVRAYNPAPGAWFHHDAGADSSALRIKVWQATPLPATAGTPGTFLQYDRDGIAVSCGDGTVLSLESLQLPGKRRAAAPQFVNQIDLT